jgi:hypothetical protein
MSIRPQDIDQTIWNVLKDRLSQIFAGQAALDPLTARVRSAGTQRWRETAKQYAGYFWAGAASFLTGLVALPVVAPAAEGPAVLTFLLLNMLGAGLVVRGFVKTQQELNRFVSPELMRGAAHLVALSRVEQLYCEAVAALIDAGPLLGETVQQEILQQLNALLENHRKLAVPVQQYQAASGSASIEALERELAELTARRDALRNDAAREMMEQSVALCARRLQYARALEPAREQAEAQQELIVQTLASVQASLARTGSTPAVPVQAEVAELQQSVTQVNHQARAVEEAVAEVMALRS